MKKVHIIGGGTISYVRPHLALAAKAYGATPRRLKKLCDQQGDKLEVNLHLTKMAGGSSMETVHDVAQLLNDLKADPDTKIIFMPVAIVDFQGIVGNYDSESGTYLYGDKADGRHGRRLSTMDCDLRTPSTWPHLRLKPIGKIIGHIRRGRKDIFVVGFKQTDNYTPEQQYIAGLNLVKEASCNLVLANDSKTRLNMVITPEEAKYHTTTDREEALKGLVEIAYLRSHLTFTRSTVVSGDSIPWNSPLVPYALRKVVDYCIAHGAYKPFRGATVGHFACKIDDTTFLTSKRKTNFNDLSENGLVMVKTDGPDSVIAYGSKPSVGGQSQRIVFSEHKAYDCIVHFHCEKLPTSLVPTVSQREIECGSHECGRNTSRGLAVFGNLSAVYLDNHGPNIVFHHSINPQEVIKFINDNFDLSTKTGGAVNLGTILQTPDTLDVLMDYDNPINE